MVAIYTFQSGLRVGPGQEFTLRGRAEAQRPRHELPAAGSRLPPAGEGDAALPAAGRGSQAAASSIEQHLQRRLQFHVDAESGRTVITVIDRDTEEIIRQIPPEEMLALARRLEATTGLLLTERA